MKLLVISDLHAHNDVLDKMDDIFAKADSVLFAGDFAEGFKPETGDEALEKLCSKHDSIFAVLGNCDNEVFMGDLEDKDICVEKALLFHEGLAFAGSGGGTKFTGKTEFERTEEECLADFDVVVHSAADGDGSLWGSTILISHNPPKGKTVDAVTAALHAGSQMFTDFILEHKPLAVICGHIHEGRGVENIGDTTVINPGSLGEKETFVWLDVEKDGNGWKVTNVEECKL